mmetsp:Transcript_47804/g.147446  ORF Transcript_47804/g.147446 Transcript_47804/m.147446 type:complete len:222 (+) Transcript_47804:164-829(+)
MGVLWRTLDGVDHEVVRAQRVAVRPGAVRFGRRRCACCRRRSIAVRRGFARWRDLRRSAGTGFVCFVVAPGTLGAHTDEQAAFGVGEQGVGDEDVVRPLQVVCVPRQRHAPATLGRADVVAAVKAARRLLVPAGGACGDFGAVKAGLAQDGDAERGVVEGHVGGLRARAVAGRLAVAGAAGIRSRPWNEVHLALRGGSFERIWRAAACGSPHRRRFVHGEH